MDSFLECNDFTVHEENLTPPISRLYEPSLNPSVKSGLAKVTIIPIFGAMYSATVPRSEIIPLLESLQSLNKQIERSEEQYRNLYYKKRDVPIIGRWLSLPIEKEGDKKLRDFEAQGQVLHDRIKATVISHMKERAYREMAKSRSADIEDFEKNLRAFGVDI